MATVRRTRSIALLAVLSLVSAARIAAGDSPDQRALPAPSDGNRISEIEVARQIDALIDARRVAAGVPHAAKASDAELMRRLYLDLTGAIPTVWEAREYLADERPEKTRELIDRLLESPSHATHLADVWRDLLLPRQIDPGQQAGVLGVQNWLRRQFVENQRYDRIVADLLVATGGDETGPALFYAALQVKPEELATATARLFLGIRLDCAQCHDHPFEQWKQRDFWGYAAFFARLEQRNRNAPGMTLVDTQFGEVKLPDTDIVVAPRYPAGDEPGARLAGTRRQQLALWIVSGDNRFLGPATVNLGVWAQLFGRGLVEPLDDFGDHNPASHPELLNLLAESFRASGYDLRWLFRTLTSTETYQLASRTLQPDPPAELFARMAVKTMTPEQLYDSIQRLMPPPSGPGNANDGNRLAFLTKLQRTSRNVTDFELSVPQALTLMNGAELSGVSDASRPGMLAALDSPLFDDYQRVDTAFLATLSRYPSKEQRTAFVEYLQSQGADHRQPAMGDVVWALVNSSEFMLNH